VDFIIFYGINFCSCLLNLFEIAYIFLVFFHS
jgi:hypothetical protein